MNIQPKKRIIVRKKKLDPYQRGYLAAQRQMSSSENDEQENSGCLCFLLGAILGPIGLIVAAIIGKTGGVKSALIGFVVSTILLVIVFAAIVLLAVGSAS